MPLRLEAAILSLTRSPLSLGIERVEREIEIMLSRFARVDRAAQRLWHDRLHGRPSLPCAPIPLDRTELRVEGRGVCLRIGPGSTGTSMLLLPLRPKKRGPFQDVPVMPLAIADRLG